MTCKGRGKKSRVMGKLQNGLWMQTRKEGGVKL